jgi:hypothetical protein
MICTQRAYRCSDSSGVQLGRIRIDIEARERCAGEVKIIACIEGPTVIERILTHLKGKEPSTEPR